MPMNKTEPEVRDALVLLDAKMKAEQKDRKIPGLSVTVVYDQETLCICFLLIFSNLPVDANVYLQDITFQNRYDG